MGHQRTNFTGFKPTLTLRSLQASHEGSFLRCRYALFWAAFKLCPEEWCGGPEDGDGIWASREGPGETEAEWLYCGYAPWLVLRLICCVCPLLWTGIDEGFMPGSYKRIPFAWEWGWGRDGCPWNDWCRIDILSSIVRSQSYSKRNARTNATSRWLRSSFFVVVDVITGTSVMKGDDAVEILGKKGMRTLSIVEESSRGPPRAFSWLRVEQQSDPTVLGSQLAGGEQQQRLGSCSDSGGVGFCCVDT